MEELLRDIRALLLIERAKAHRRITANAAPEDLTRAPNGEALLTWPAAIKAALWELEKTKALIP